MKLLATQPPVGLLPDVAAHSAARARWARQQAARLERYERDRQVWLTRPPEEPQVGDPPSFPPCATCCEPDGHHLEDAVLPCGACRGVIPSPAQIADAQDAYRRRLNKHAAWEKRRARLLAPFGHEPFQLALPGADEDQGDRLPGKPCHACCEPSGALKEDAVLPCGTCRGAGVTRQPRTNRLVALLRSPCARGQRWHPLIPRTMVSRRKPKAIGTPPLRPEERRDGKELAAIKRMLPVLRPKSREDCRNTIRPCPFAGCPMHLYLDVNPKNGSIKYNFPGQEIDDLEETCARDVEERGGTTLEGVGKLMNITLERTRQIAQAAARKLKPLIDPDPPEDTGYYDEFAEDLEDDQEETGS